MASHDEAEPLPDRSTEPAALPPTAEHPPAEAAQAEPDSQSVVAAPASSGGRWRVISLLPDDGDEPSARLTGEQARAILAARTAPWHPAVLAHLRGLPICENLAWPSGPAPDEIRLIPAGFRGRLAAGYETQFYDMGGLVIEVGPDRDAAVAELCEKLKIQPGPSEGELAGLARDFLALGMARWWLRDLTLAMGHADYLDMDALTREVQGGAQAWLRSDAAGCTSRLRAGFECLTQARERFYPIEAYLLDVCLLDETTPAEHLAGVLDQNHPITFLADARSIEAIGQADVTQIERLRAAIDEGWADVVGGTYRMTEEPFLPLESILWQFQEGALVYRRWLDERTTETLARRRFGLYPLLPQIARRFGFRYAVLWALDAGRWPVPRESKRLWESPDGSHLESLTRPPLGADQDLAGLQLPWRVGQAMKDDQVTTLALAHWPRPVASWYGDLRRVTAYSPVLARSITLNDYFHQTDRPFEMHRCGLDSYVTPYLDQAVARGDSAGVSRLAAVHRLRLRCDAVAAMRSILRMVEPLTQACAEDGAPGEASVTDLERGRLDEAAERLPREEADLAARVARVVTATATSQRPGWLVVNPLGVARRVPVCRSGDGDRDSEQADWVMVEVPPFGFAWVESSGDSPAAATRPEVLDRTIRTDGVEVVIDPSTGGLRAVRRPAEPYARLGQQLVATGRLGPDGQPVASRMAGESFTVRRLGSLGVDAISTGMVVDPEGDVPLCRFSQRVRLWTNRPLVELTIELSELEPGLLARFAHPGTGGWRSYIGSRWAWPDPEATLRRTTLLHPVETTAARPETPDAFDITTRSSRTAILFGGLSHHQREGARMLDTVLVTGKEASRRFEMGIVLDQDFPFHASWDLLSPALVVPMSCGPPQTGAVGWFFRIDRKGVAITRVTPFVRESEQPVWGLRFHLLETTGRASRCRLSLVLPPVQARQVDCQGEPVVDLVRDGDAVLIDLTPNELACVEVVLGGP